MCGMDDDFDPTRLLDGWRAAPPRSPEGVPDLNLDALLPQGQRLPEAERIRRLRERGYEMRDVEDIELPEVHLPPPAPAAPVDAADLDEALRAAARLGGDTVLEPTLPELVMPPPRRRADPRLLKQWRPGAWIGACRRITGASTELSQGPQGPLLESHSPQWLLALWPPQGLDQPLLSRWPQQLLLRELEDEAVAERLLDLLPAVAPLWLAELDPDWGLLADIVLHHDAELRPAQLQTLRGFIEAERLARFERLNQLYERDAAGVVRSRPTGPRE